MSSTALAALLYIAWAPVAGLATPAARDFTDQGRRCQDPRWAGLHAALQAASERQDYWYDVFSPEVFALTDGETFEWFKSNYQTCVEGLLSLVLYLSLHMAEREASLLDLASRTARELNPLALRSGLASWPLFGRLDKLQLVWQAGQHASPLLTEPWLLPPACRAVTPRVIYPLLFQGMEGEPARWNSSETLAAAWGWKGANDEDALSETTTLRLARHIRPGTVLVDAGVFDGTDWSLMGILAGATVIGFEPLAENRRLVDERLPAGLGAHIKERTGTTSGPWHTLLPVQPGESAPKTAWSEVFQRQLQTCVGMSGCIAGRSSPATKPPAGWGHSYIVGAALGERVRSLNMTGRYDYSSVADQGYLRGPANMQVEEVAMTTLDTIFRSYLGNSSSHGKTLDSVEVLKLDVEGYEMGALRGAEQLLASSRVRFLVLEFHPGMLGSSGTDPQGLLEFLNHYCFRCYSLKIARPFTFKDFVARYTTSATLPMQGLGELEDLVCESTSWSER